jgi:hypothetical protein
MIFWLVMPGGDVRGQRAAVVQGAHRYLVEIIAHCVWLYVRFPLFYREVEELMLRRGVLVERGDGFSRSRNLDDGTYTLDGYHSLLHGPTPEYVACADWTDEIAQLAETLKQWRDDIAQPTADGTVRDPNGTMAVCVADGEMAGRVATDLEMKHGITTPTELTKRPVEDVATALDPWAAEPPANAFLQRLKERELTAEAVAAR